MTETEKIKKLLNLNNFAAAIVVDEDAYVHGANNFASEKLHSVEVGKNLYSIFDKNTALLVKNNLIDVKAYKKIQRRKVNVLTVESTEKLQLIISPFSINDKTYYYVLIFNENVEENLIAYPTIDDKNIRSKYWQILQQVDKALPQTLIEKKNFQFDLNVEKTPITIWGKDNYLFANDSFLKFTFMSNEEILRKNPAQIFEFSLTEKLNQVEEVLYSIQNMMIIESTEYSIDDIQQINRIVCTPIFDNEENVIATINFGGINPKRSEGKIIKAIDESVEIKTETKTKTENETVVSISSKRKFDNEPDDVKIIYDKNTFKILEVNESAVKLYGYSSEELLKMDITGLCAPEDMQKLLAPIGEANKSIDFKHIKSDGSDVLVEVIQEIVDWNNVEAKLNLIKPKEKKKTKVKEKNKYKKVSQKELPKDDLKPKVKKESTRKKVAKKKDSKNKASEIKNKVASPVAPFLSSLFHELLTPVNVILGFVQEIVDSIDKPTEEQAESAQIIKSNQQLLLQTMNTAVQYSQVNEGIIKQNIEEFNLNNYLIDLKDSVA
ncbi:MAG: PAS domain-containing protein, partial [Ignavibacteriae bacterium]|nr:PAS domain-containing protein [Ignavibacteriota bacterium]